MIRAVEGHRKIRGNQPQRIACGYLGLREIDHVIASSLGEGSTFSFTLQLPKQKADVPGDHPPVAALDYSSNAQTTTSSGALKDIKVLLAEDGRVNQLVATRLLNQLGCTVDIAENGREAVEAWRKNHYGIIFMDCHMPEMDGYAATRRIRELEAEKNLSPAQIIALTASTMEGDRELCMAAGMSDFTSKPISKQALETALKKAAALVSI
jgi:CheY-like chemotaxis protein